MLCVPGVRANITSSQLHIISFPFLEKQPQQQEDLHEASRRR